MPLLEGEAGIEKSSLPRELVQALIGSVQASGSKVAVKWRRVAGSSTIR